MYPARNSQMTAVPVLVQKAAASALLQQRRGHGSGLRQLYYEAHSLLRTLRGYLAQAA